MNSNDIIDFKGSLYFPQYSTVLADKYFPEVLGELKSKLKKVALWHSYDSDYKKSKFKTTNTSHIEMNKTAKRQMYKFHKGMTSAKKEGLYTHAMQKGIHS